MEWEKRVLWMAGRVTVYPEWEVLGVFSSEERATAECKTPFDFIGVFVLDEPFGDNRSGRFPQKPDAFYPWKYARPRLRKKESGVHHDKS